MILPQSEAFSLLLRRLSAIPPSSMNTSDSKSEQSKTRTTVSESKRNKINFKELFEYFNDIQDKHKEQKHKQRQILLTNTQELTHSDI